MFSLNDSYITSLKESKIRVNESVISLHGPSNVKTHVNEICLSSGHVSRTNSCLDVTSDFSEVDSVKKLIPNTFLKFLIYHIYIIYFNKLQDSVLNQPR